MKTIIIALLLVIPSFCFAEQYLCVADAANGFAYNSMIKKWERTFPNIQESRYIISPSNDNEFVYEINKMGLKSETYNLCRVGFTDKGYLICDGRLGNFQINKTNVRFLMTFPYGYVDVESNSFLNSDLTSPRPKMEIGTCSSF